MESAFITTVLVVLTIVVFFWIVIRNVKEKITSAVKTQGMGKVLEFMKEQADASSNQYTPSEDAILRVVSTAFLYRRDGQMPDRPAVLLESERRRRWVDSLPVQTGEEKFYKDPPSRFR